MTALDDEAREAFDLLLADEPPLALTLGAVVSGGRGVRRRRRVAYGTGVALTAAGVAAVAVAVPLSRHDAPARIVAAKSAPATAPATAPARAFADLTPRQRVIAEAIAASTPHGWTLDLGADRWDGEQGVDGTADDGAGPGMLGVGISTATQILHVCAEPEFVDGAPCTERVLADGSVLSLRGPGPHDTNVTVQAVLTHPDGSGVNASSGAFTVNWPPAKPVVATRTRPAPAYSLDQLAEMVLAVDRAVRG